MCDTMNTASSGILGIADDNTWYFGHALNMSGSFVDNGSHVAYIVQ